MTADQKKQLLEETLRKIGKMPPGSGSVTAHISPNNKVSKIEVKDVE